MRVSRRTKFPFILHWYTMADESLFDLDEGELAYYSLLIAAAEGVAIVTDEDIKALGDVDLLQRLADACMLTRYYESAEGEWSRETEARNRAKVKFGKLLDEAAARNLNYQECLQ